MEPPNDSLRLFAQRRIQSVYLSHRTVVGRISRNEIDLVGIVLYAVKDGFSKRTVIAAELVVPATGIVLGAEDRRGFLPPSVQQFQDVMLLCLRRFQQEPFIIDEENRVGVLGLNLLVSAICPCQVEFEEHIRQTHILCLVALLACFHAEGIV